VTVLVLARLKDTKSHRRPSSRDCSGHCVSLDCVKILDKDSGWFERGVNKAIHIRTHQLNLNNYVLRGSFPAHTHLTDNTLQSHVTTVDLLMTFRRKL